MGTEVATQSRTELAQASTYDPFARAGDDMAGSSAVYAKFNGNSGEFTYGSSAIEVENGERMAAHVAGARRGWICWVDSEVAEEIMIPIIDGPPPHENALTNHGPYKKHEDGTEDGWSAQFSIEFRLLGEDHDGVQITYKTSTKSAMRPLGDLIKQYGREYKNHPGMIPIVEFSKGSYMPKEKKHGKKYFPQFKIVDWMDEDELLATYGEGSKVDEGDDNDNLIEAPKTEVKKAATKAVAAPKKAPAKAPVDEAPAVDEKAAKAALLAKKKAELEAQLAAMQAGEEDEGEEEAEVEEAEADADEEVAVEEAKPAPAASRTRRRSF